MEQFKHMKENRIWPVFELIILFMINGYKFLNSKRNELPLQTLLFNIIFYLRVIVLLLNNYTKENELKNKLDKYFNLK